MAPQDFIQTQKLQVRNIFSLHNSPDESERVKHVSLIKLEGLQEE